MPLKNKPLSTDPKPRKLKSPIRGEYNPPVIKMVDRKKRGGGKVHK